MEPTKNWFNIESKGNVTDSVLVEFLLAIEGVESHRIVHPGFIEICFAEGKDFTSESYARIEKYAHIHRIPYQRVSEKYL